MPSPTTQDVVSISLDCFTPVQTTQNKSKMVQEKIIQKPVVKKEVIKKPVVKKEIIKKEAVVPVAEPVKEKIVEEKIIEKPLIKEEVISEQKLTQEQSFKQENIKKEQTKNPQVSTKALQQQFVQTNFEVIRNMLLPYVNYPNMAKRMGQTGVVKLILTINTKGKLIDAYVQNSSGHRILDKSAIKAVKHLAKLQLPAPKTQSNILIPIAFSLN